MPSSIYVKHICAQLTANTAVEIRSYLDLDLLFEGPAKAVPPEIRLLEVTRFQMHNNKYILYVC